MKVLKNCRFIPELVEGYEGTSGDILVEDGRILEVTEGKDAYPEDAEVYDMGGKYALPGFFDMHIHLSLSGGDTLIDNAKSPVQQTLDAVKFAQDSLYAGFTTIRDVGSCYNVAVDLRNAINDGKITGPNIIACGKIITPTESGNEFFADMYEEADGPEEILKAVRNEMKKGADFIKIMGTGAVMNPGGEPGQPIYTLDELKAVVEAAKFKDTYVATHCHGTQAIKNSIIAGVHTIEHASVLDDEAIEMLKGNEDTFIIPTLNVIYGLVDSVPESSTFMMAKAKWVMERIKIGIRKAYDAGLLLGFGTDQGATPLRHGKNGAEFVLRKEFWDMKEIDILKQATINSAIIAGCDKDYGTIKAGKVADIVGIDGNPIEDISRCRDNVEVVVKSGELVKGK